ncbi:MAG: methyltransferase domain-containing protein [Burkholderiales bacterium]|nr:methyltransferase domain-containing protein [Burkholderiales bacterium]
MSWNPQQYLKFEEPRLRPAVDLLGRVGLTAPRTVYDLGCGTGNVTKLIAARWPQAEITGVDDSGAMLAQAAKNLPNLRWVGQSLAHWSASQPADLVYSNAALHWLPQHEQLFPHLVQQLAPGGVLAVQMPRNFEAPSHTAIAQTVAAGPWREQLSLMVKPAPVAPPQAYYDWLKPLARTLDIWETEYLQVLTGPDAVKEWTKGTWLKQFLDALEPAAAADFEAAYAERVRSAYPMRADGSTLFPFRRLFIVLTRP